MTTLAEKANLRGVFIPYVDYGFNQDEGPQFGEILFHCGEYRKRENYFDDDDDLICHRFGYELEDFILSPSDGLYFEIHPEIEIASEEWQAWLRWCLKKWEEDFDYNGTINSGTGADTIDLDIVLDIDINGKIFRPFFDFTFDLINTPNN